MTHKNKSKGVESSDLAGYPVTIVERRFHHVERKVGFLGDLRHILVLG